MNGNYHASARPAFIEPIGQLLSIAGLIKLKRGKALRKAGDQGAIFHHSFKRRRGFRVAEKYHGAKNDNGRHKNGRDKINEVLQKFLDFLKLTLSNRFQQYPHGLGHNLIVGNQGRHR